MIGKQFYEILPRVFPDWNAPTKALEDFKRIQAAEFHRPCDIHTRQPGWGSPGSQTPGVLGFYLSQSALISRSLDFGDAFNLLDVSGAVGTHVSRISQKVGAAINCDMHGPSIVEAHTKAPDNVLCIRASYLQLPIADNSIDNLICTDTLIRGPDHDLRTLREIMRVLKTGGIAFVDFHLKRRLTANKNIQEYRWNEIEYLLNCVGVDSPTITGNGYVPATLVPAACLYPMLDLAFRIMNSPSRIVATFRKKKTILDLCEENPSVKTTQRGS